MKSAGTCTIAADQAGGDNYLAAPQVLQSVTIGKASQTITFAGPGDRTFTTAPIPLTATSTSGLTVAFAATGNCTVVGVDADPHRGGQLHDHREPGGRHELRRRARRSCAPSRSPRRTSPTSGPC